MEDDKITTLRQPGDISDPLTEVLRNGARALLDTMLGAIGAAVMANRTLGGLCDWIEAEAPVTDDIEAFGALPGRFADLAILAVYATTDPLN